MISAHALAYRQFLETLSPDAVHRLGDYLAPDVRFRDPFNDVRGREAMVGVFRHMFASCVDVRFAVHHLAETGAVCLMDWSFEARIRGRSWRFDGMSRVAFDEQGLVVDHVDHWDASTQFYAQIPVIGWLLGAIRRRVAGG